MENILSETQKDALKAFASKGDRREPFMFVGRGDILDDVETQLRETREAERSVQNARVIRGAPGSGKSSVLGELQRRYSDTNVVPVALSGEMLNHPVKIAEAVATACGFGQSAIHGASVQSVSGGIHSPLAGFSIALDRRARLPVEELESGVSPWSVLSRCINIPQDTVFLFLIDEAQRVERDDASGNNEIALGLLDGATGEMKITTVFGGLLDTPVRLRAVGGSPRLVADGLHRIGALAEEEVHDLVRAFLGHEPFGLYELPIDMQAAARTIADESDCYPRHVQSYLRGIAKAFSSNHQSVGIEDAMNTGRAYRVQFYGEILANADMDEFGEALIEFVKQAPDNKEFNFYDVDAIARERFGMNREAAKESFKRAIHCGVLEPCDEMSPLLASPMKFPVPSLRTFVATGLDHTDQTIAPGERRGLGA